MPNVQELYDERAKIVKQAQDLQNKVDGEKRRFTSEEKNQLNAMYADVDNLTSDIDIVNKQNKVNSLLSVAGERRVLPEPPNLGPKDTNAAALSIDYGRGNVVEYPVNSPEYQRGQKAYLRAFGNYLKTGHITGELYELAQQADSATGGGYLVAPQQMVAGILKFVDDAVVIRGLASRYTVGSSDSLGVVTLETDVDDADWTTELLTGNETEAVFGKRELHPHAIAKRVKISNKLLAKSVIPVEQMLRERLGYKFALTQEKAFMTGDGFNKPLGLFTASTQGVPTTRDVSTGNTTSSITIDGLINALYSLKAQYQMRATWLLHRDGLKKIRLLKDVTSGQYLWQPSVQAGQPDTILGRPIAMSEYVPNTFTTGQYVGMVADFSYYWIADSIQMTMQRLVELYAATNQIGIIGRMELDAQPVLPEAFVRIQLA